MNHLSGMAKSPAWPPWRLSILVATLVAACDGFNFRKVTLQWANVASNWIRLDEAMCLWMIS